MDMFSAELNAQVGFFLLNLIFHCCCAYYQQYYTICSEWNAPEMFYACAVEGSRGTASHTAAADSGKVVETTLFQKRLSSLLDFGHVCVQSSYRL